MDKAMHSEIPQWVIDYNNAGHQSSAGRAVNILMKENKALRSELQKQKELNAEIRIKSLNEAFNTVSKYQYRTDGSIRRILDDIESLIKKSKES